MFRARLLSPTKGDGTGQATPRVSRLFKMGARGIRGEFGLKKPTINIKNGHRPSFIYGEGNSQGLGSLIIESQQPNSLDLSNKSIDQIDSPAL